MSKKLNIANITSDLEGSAFFPAKKIPVPSPIQKTAIKKEPRPEKKEVKESKPEPLVPTVQVERPTPKVEAGKRVIKQRHPFDIFQDQYEDLRNFSLDEKRDGSLGSMSAMVRDALDTYITSRKK
jgi:hypothetical protein